jgi:hypothetical protein
MTFKDVKGEIFPGSNDHGTVVRHSCEKGAIIFLQFFILNINFNLYNDIFDEKNEFKCQIGVIGILKKKF